MSRHQEAGRTGQTGRTVARILESKPALQIALIVLLASLLTSPCILRGIPDGHDSVTHVAYQHHFSEQFWHGDPYPRWLSGENKGTGSPIFLLQYPLPYYLTALLRPIVDFAPGPTREARELGLFCFIALACAGVAARCWFRSYAGALAATFSAAVYISLPYFATLIYTRAAIGELTALVWMPLILASMEWAAKDTRGYLGCALCFALLLASNPLISLLFAPLAAAYAAVTARRHQGSAAYFLVRMVGAWLLGAGLAAVYLLPLAAYRRLFDLGAMARYLPNFELGRNFLYLDGTVTAEPRVRAVIVVALLFGAAAATGLLRSSEKRWTKMALTAVMALGLACMLPGLGPWLIRSSGLGTSFERYPLFMAILLTTSLCSLLLGVIAYCRCSPDNDLRQQTLLTVACLAFLMMLPFSAPLWKAIPALAIVQFPFRLGSILTLAVAGLVASYLTRRLEDEAVATRLTRVWTGGIVAAWAIGVGAVTATATGCLGEPSAMVKHTPPDMDIMYRTYLPPGNLHRFAHAMGTEPGSLDLFPRPQDDHFSATMVTGEGKATVTRRGSGRLEVTADCSTPAVLQLRQLYFPLWKRVSMDGSEQASGISISPEGFRELPLSPGKERLLLVFDGGWPERWGKAISGGSLLATFALWGVLRLQRRQSLGGDAGSGLVEGPDR